MKSTKTVKTFALLMCALMVLTAFTALVAARGEPCEECNEGTVRKGNTVKTKYKSVPTPCNNTVGATDSIVTYRYTTTWKCDNKDCGYEYETYRYEEVYICDHGPHNAG